MRSEFPNYFTGRTTPAGAGSASRILITGGSGFIGTNLVEYYRNQPGFEVINVDIAEPRNAAHAPLRRAISILDFEQLREVFQEFQPDIVFNLAARTDLDGRTLDDYATNVQGVANVVRAIAELMRKPEATLFASSRLVCRIGYTPRHDSDYCATTVYGQSKIRTEEIVRELAGSRFPWVLFRPTSIWGPWFSVPYRNFFDTVRRGIYFHPRGSAIRKSYGFVGNSVHQLDRLAFSGFQAALNKMLYLCDYEPIEVGAWSAEIAHSFGMREPRSVPKLLLRAGARAGDLIEAASGRHAPITSFRLDNILTEMVHDTGKLGEIVGPLPYRSTEGVAVTKDWMVWDTADGRSL